MQQYQSKILWFALCYFISINEIAADEYTYFSSKDFNSEKTIKDLRISNDSVQVYRILAIEFANKSEAKKSTEYIIKYISATSDMSFLNDYLFNKIKDSEEYLALNKKYTPKLGVLGFFYFCAGLLGVFVFLILNLKKSANKINTLLISLFVLFHSIFMLHLVLYIVNVQYYVPHALFVSTTFSFLYGPLLYFYFKRITHNYKFRLTDLLHLIPSVAILIYILPYYMMSRLEKFNVVFDQSNSLLPGAYTIIIVKILSLSIYAYLIICIYNKNKSKLNSFNKNNYLWQRNIIAIHIVYVVSYIIYATVLVKIIDYPILFNLQVMVMAGVVFYVAYISYVQPEIFMGKIKLVDPSNLFKYKNSGLTPSYSIDLSNNLLHLLNEDKIYKENSLSLEILSDKLETTRHNASQIINEHFDMNFSELINKYRVFEAADIFKNDSYNSLTIIEVAYEVGFNNKVTFNKSFKKYFSQTPSQYIKTLQP